MNIQVLLQFSMDNVVVYTYFNIVPSGSYSCVLNEQGMTPRMHTHTKKLLRILRRSFVNSGCDKKLVASEKNWYHEVSWYHVSWYHVIPSACRSYQNFWYHNPGSLYNIQQYPGLHFPRRASTKNAKHDHERRRWFLLRRRWFPQTSSRGWRRWWTGWYRIVHVDPSTLPCRSCQEKSHQEEEKTLFCSKSNRME